MGLFSKKKSVPYIEGDEWSWRKEGGHYIHGDEPLICPLSGEEFYRWQWEKVGEEHGREIRDNRHLNTEDGMYRLVSPNTALTRGHEIKQINNAIWERERAEWDALTIQEKIVQFDMDAVDTGPPRQLTEQGEYQIWSNGKWETIKGTVNELTGKIAEEGWDFIALDYGGKN